MPEQTLICLRYDLSSNIKKKFKFKYKYSLINLHHKSNITNVYKQSNVMFVFNYFHINKRLNNHNYSISQTKFYSYFKQELKQFRLFNSK